MTDYDDDLAFAKGWMMGTSSRLLDIEYRIGKIEQLLRDRP